MKLSFYTIKQSFDITNQRFSELAVALSFFIDFQRFKVAATNRLSKFKVSYEYRRSWFSHYRGVDAE